MNLNERQVFIIRILYERNKPLAHGSDDDRRVLTRMMAEQMCLEFGSDWGVKARDASSPQGKDAIAYRITAASMDIWDWQNGATREPQVYDGMPPSYPNVTDQYFIEVSPVNHVGNDEPGNGQPPVPPDNDDEVLDAIDDLKSTMLSAFAITDAKLDEINIKLNNMNAKLDAIINNPVRFPNYQGRIPMFGGNTTLTPVG